MKSRSMLLLLSAIYGSALFAESITVDGKDYQYERLIERKIGPGTTHLRLRLPDYPLNVNIITVDLNNQYNRIETTVANESAKGTESLVAAAKRLDTESHHPIAAANANFWVVGSQNEYPLYAGITRNVSLRNGKLVTECNNGNEKWDGGPGRTGIVSISTDKVLNIDYCEPSYTWRHADKTGLKKIQTCNKGFRQNQYAIYNSFYGRDRAFMPYEVVDKKYTLKTDVTNAIENLLDLDEGEQWIAGKEITFVCKEVRKNTNGRGTLGNHDLAIVSFGTYTPNLEPGKKIKLKYDWTFEETGTPLVEQAIGGNAMVMRKGELTEHNYNETYNSQIYSRTGYGCSKDGKTLFMIVIDKSTDPVYGKSAGCSTAAMCEIARHFGCWNMSNFDAGGSAEMMVGNKIINKTTESTPRPVANGWMVFNTAPEDDNTLASLEFDHPVIDLTPGETFTPVILGYNRYETLTDEDVKNFTLSCSPEVGFCSGQTLTAASNVASGTITATVGNISVTKRITVGGGEAGINGISEDTASNISFPSCVTACGEIRVQVKTGMLTRVEIIDCSGMILARTVQMGETICLPAPERKGIYIIRAMTAEGRVESSKLSVR